jgi:hypothetical protein
LEEIFTQSRKEENSPLKIPGFAALPAPNVFGSGATLREHF